MTINVKMKGRRRRLLLKGDMNIYSAQDIKRQFLEHLDSAAELEINLAQVGEIDTAGFQVLYLVKREAIKGGKTLCLTSHSPAVLEIMDLYNMAAYFGDSMSSGANKARAPASKSQSRKPV